MMGPAGEVRTGCVPAPGEAYAGRYCLFNPTGRSVSDRGGTKGRMWIVCERAQWGYAFSFLLPEIYGDMVTDWDISEINSGRIKYTLVRTIKKCGPDRVPFDAKNFTWDLVLLRL